MVLNSQHISLQPTATFPILPSDSLLEEVLAAPETCHKRLLYASILLLIMCSLPGEFLFLFQTLPSLNIFFSDPGRNKYSQFSAFKFFIQYSVVIGLDV